MPPGHAPAPYACRPEASRGRLVPETESAIRSVFQRDRDRIIHSTAFRRLKHKTQVFVYHEGDHYRTRLTHSLEVAQIARIDRRALDLNEDLAEALALAHDLGHTPFGHAGEEALDAAMDAYGGFDHNAQTLRILTKLERRYADFDGLNLTWETLEGVVKHNGPLTGQWADPAKRDRLPAAIARIRRRCTTSSSTPSPAPRRRWRRWPTTSPTTTTTSTTACAPGCSRSPTSPTCRWSARCSARCRTAIPAWTHDRLIGESIRRLIDRMVADLLAETRARARRRRGRARRTSCAGSAGRSSPSPTRWRRNDAGLRAFLFERMYRHYKVNRMTSKARRVVRELFRLFLAEPELPARGMDASRRRAAHAAHGPAGRRLHRRHDRPLRARGASPAVRHARFDSDEPLQPLPRRSRRARLRRLAAQGALPPGLDLSRITVEPPRDATHGDLSTNAAMVLAKHAGQKPRDIAELLAGLADRPTTEVEAADIAGPGFINLRLKPGVLARAPGARS